MTAKKVRAQSPGPQGTSSQHVNIIEAIPPEETQPLAQVLNQSVPTTAQPVYTATSVPPLPPTPQMSSTSSSSHGTVIAYPDISQTSKILRRSPPPVPERSLDAAKTTPAILLVGLTGSGKSTLISHLTKAAVTIGHDLNSCTSEIATYTANIGGTVVRLIDTPGFDDTNRSDTDILSAIAVTLAMLYRERVPLLGVLYLHRISDTRVGGASRKCLRILENLAGQAAFGCILIATTMWDKVSPAEGERREQELVLNPQFFGTLYNKGSGAKIMRHLGTRESAREIIKQIMTRWGGQSVVLQIQRQLVDEGLPLESTTAGRFVDAALREQQAKQQEEIKELEAALQECRDDSTLALLKEEHQAQLARVQELTTSRQGLRGNYKQLADRIIPSPEKSSAEWERERESASREDSIAASEILALKEEVQMLKDQLRLSQDSQTEQEITLLTVKAEQRNQKYKTEAEVRRALQKAFEEKSAELVRMERHRERKRLESQRYGHGSSSISSHHHHTHGGARGISTGERFLRWIAGPGYSVSMFG